MVNSGVKRKLPIILLTAATLFTAFLSWSGWLPADLVERIYAHHAYPMLSHIAKFFADSVGFSWLDVWIIAVLAALLISLLRRNWQFPLGLICVGYLIFFWGWG